MTYTSPIFLARPKLAGSFIDDGFSALPPDEPIIVNGRVYRRGRIPRDYTRHALCSTPGASPFPANMMVPENEWLDRCKEKDAAQSWPSDIWRAAGLAPQDQNGTNYCWCNGVTTCARARRAFDNLRPVALSAASMAAKIKNFRNEGGWGAEALEYAIENGWATTTEWPENAINRQYDTAATNAVRPKYKVTEWYDMAPRRFDQLVSALLYNIPVAIGLNWWSHEVAAMAVRYKAGVIVIEILNSWGDWEDNGFSTLSRSKATADDQCAPVVLTASA